MLTNLAHPVDVMVALVMRAQVFAGVTEAVAAAEPVTRVGNVPSRGASLVQCLQNSLIALYSFVYADPTHLLID